MKFGPVPVAQAEGCLLAHAFSDAKGKLPKGHLLNSDDLSALTAAGHSNVLVAQLDDGDVVENEAAGRLAQLLSRDLISAEPAFTGRANLYARKAGVFCADVRLVNELNGVDPSITLATLADDTFVEAGRMVATVKIIPLAVSAAALEGAERALSGGQAISLASSKPHRVGLIATELPGLKQSTMDKTARILLERLALAGSTLLMERRVEHGADAVAVALSEMKNDCDMLIVFGASAIADRHDVIPMGIEQAGGDVHSFGMPVDPGNLLLTGQIEDVPIIGAPGCARSPVENGFDWVLHRMLAGLPTDTNYVGSLGVGGLLMEIKARPQPREG